MKAPADGMVMARSKRLGPGVVTVTWQKGRVSRVALGRTGSRKTDNRELAQGIENVLAGKPIPEELHVDAGGLPAFTKKVLGLCAGIRPGRLMTYGELARLAGRPRASRGVGTVMARNPFSLLIPCHRVVAIGGRLNGYGGGLDWKEHLLACEGWRFEGKGRNRRIAREQWLSRPAK